MAFNVRLRPLCRSLAYKRKLVKSVLRTTEEKTMEMLDGQPGLAHCLAQSPACHVIVCVSDQVI